MCTIILSKAAQKGPICRKSYGVEACVVFGSQRGSVWQERIKRTGMYETINPGLFRLRTSTLILIEKRVIESF